KEGYYYRCKKRMVSLKSVWEHCRSIRNIKCTSCLNIQDIHKEPNVRHNPNFYCKSFEKRYQNRKSFRSH
ncbi:hypothetical protein V8B55DRAFT_1291844, partial [Mucor lusitanicus]